MCNLATLLAMQDELSKGVDDNLGSATTSDVFVLLTNTSAHNNNVFIFRTKQGRRYSPSTQKSYYTLLARCQCC